MTRSDRGRVGRLGVIVWLFVAWPCWGQLLPFGDLNLPGTTRANQPDLIGTILEQTRVPYEFGEGTNHVSGMIEATVLRRAQTGFLDFYWRIVPDADSLAGIYTFRVGGFRAALLGANWRGDAGGDVPPLVARNFPNGSVNFIFSQSSSSPSIGPTNSSTAFFLRTEAKEYSREGSFDLLSAPSDQVSSLYPTFAPIPPGPRVTFKDPTHLMVSWDAWATNYFLESTKSLTAPAWAPIEQTPATAASEEQTIVQPTGGAEFYRLTRR